jgi:23S rRNA (cytidine2498-2'-O)-methyltransferase
VAPEGFTHELLRELELDGWNPIEQRERWIWARGPAESLPIAWAQNTWLEPRKIEIASIAQGARALRDLNSQWALHSTGFHRRARLIQDQLPPRKERLWRFLEPLSNLLADTPLGSWTLLEPHGIVASASCTSRVPNGEIHFVEERLESPSRAYLKLWDLFTCFGFRPSAGERCVDLGSAPGGWTWVLQNLGARVLSVDGARLDPRVESLPRVEYRKGDAFRIKPAELGPVDWAFCDVIAYPAKTLELIETWMRESPRTRLVFTIKFRGETDFEVVQSLKRIAGSRLVHLSHNKHELTWFKTDLV